MGGAGAPLQALAPAKINLWLHVTGRRADGYHEIDSLVAFADIGDRLTATAAATASLTVSGPFAAALAPEHERAQERAGADNLVLRAARALAAYRGVSGCGPGGGPAPVSDSVPAGVAFHLDKQLPVAAGLGGGSADAAAALLLCARLWRVGIGRDALFRLARGLGADVPVCLQGGLQGGVVRVTGAGERLAVPDPPPPSVPAVLVNPGVAVSTGAVFAAFAASGTRFSPPAALRDGDLAQRAGPNRNDLEAPASARAPVIADVLAALGGAPGVRLARMSGSGATCFGLFASAAAARAAAGAIAQAHPAWWTVACRIGGPA